MRSCADGSAETDSAGAAKAIGLTLGTSIGQTQIGLMFSLVLAPMIFFGCTYYPWSALAKFPILQKAVLINPVVYASEGLRSALVPQFPHLSIAVILGALLHRRRRPRPHPRSTRTPTPSSFNDRWLAS